MKPCTEANSIVECEECYLPRFAKGKEMKPKPGTIVETTLRNTTYAKLAYGLATEVECKFNVRCEVQPIAKDLYAVWCECLASEVNTITAYTAGYVMAFYSFGT